MKPTWQLPNQFVPSAQRVYLEHLGFRACFRLLKYLKRRFVFHLIPPFLGRGRECQKIGSTHRRILWVNFAAPSLGDSLMDLAARNLLEGRELVLLTDEKNAGLYLHDHYFSGVYTSGREVRAAFQGKAFDLVICDSYSPRVLLEKVRAAPGVDFVSVYGFLNGFEVHRTYFAFARMMEMLSLERIDDPIRPTISLPKACVTAPKADVCVAVGGEWDFRTYEHWLPVIEWLAHRGLSITLVGSRNGIEYARNIEKTIPSVRSTVGQLSLSEVIGEIANSTVFIGADGGLWHIACAIPKPTVVLFADCQIFDEAGNRVTRETTDMVCETLYTDVEVSNISPHAVTEACERIFARIGI